MLKHTDRPLLANDATSSEHSRDTQDHIEEEDALLTGQPSPKQRQQRRGGQFWRQIGLLTWALLATVVAVILGVLYGREHAAAQREGERGRGSGKPTGKRNLVFMVSDGMGPTSLSLTRSFRQTQFGLPYDDVLVLDQHLIGSSRTRSASSLITDSAAGATVFSCGKKTYNGAISVLPDHSPCGTILEAAKKAGYMTGLVVTTRITDATPAVFASHVRSRAFEDEIAEQEVGLTHPMGRVLDLMLGGGRCHFLPNSSVLPVSCRDDDTDVVTRAQQEYGWNYLSTRDEFDDLKLDQIPLPLLGLFADTDIPYEIDRVSQNDTYPSLDEMARVALRALSDATRDSDQGFFLMIEGSLIDHAGHSNDPAAQVHEVLAYDRAIATVLDFLKEDSTPGVMVSTSDHETGGLALARQLPNSDPIYQWYPQALVNVSHSATFLSEDLRAHFPLNPPSSSSSGVAVDSDKNALLKTYLVHTTLAAGLGITNATPAELESLLAAYAGTGPFTLHGALADMVSRRGLIGWTSHGHSAVDVNIYASDAQAVKGLAGNHENTEIGVWMREYLDLDEEVKEVTRLLRKAFSKGEGKGGETSVQEQDETPGREEEEGELRDRRRKRSGIMDEYH